MQPAAPCKAIDTAQNKKRDDGIIAPSSLYFQPRLRLLARADPEHPRATDGADALGSRPTVLHSDLLGILHLALCLALHAASLHIVPSLLQASPLCGVRVFGVGLPCPVSLTVTRSTQPPANPRIMGGVIRRCPHFRALEADRPGYSPSWLSTERTLDDGDRPRSSGGAA